MRITSNEPVCFEGWNKFSVSIHSDTSLIGVRHFLQLLSPNQLSTNFPQNWWKKLFAVLFNVICSFIAVVVRHFGLATYSNQNLGETSLHRPSPGWITRAKTWMKPRYSTKEKGKWSLPWPTSALLSLRLDLQIRHQMAFHVWKDGIFAQSTICIKLNATQVHIRVVLLGINNFCLTFKCKCGFCWCLNHVQERCSEIYCMVAYNNEASKKD